jgi:hypothetical protein
MHSLLNLSELIPIIHHILLYVFFLFIGFSYCCPKVDNINFRFS